MGSMKEAIDACKVLLDACPAFREIVGSDIDPLTRIHWRSVAANPVGIEEEFTPDQLANIRPCATLAHGTFSQSQSAMGLWPCNGSIEVTVLQNVDEEDLISDFLVDAEAELDWVKKCDRLLADVRKIGIEASGLVAHTISVLLEPGAASREEMQKCGPFYGFRFLIEYGSK